MSLLVDKNTKMICITRGDHGAIDFKDVAGSGTTLKQGDLIRFKIYERLNPKNTYVTKDIPIEEDTSIFRLELTSEDTTFTDVSDSKDFWYELCLNPDTTPQTLVGYRKLPSGKVEECVFRLWVEGGGQER